MPEKRKKLKLFIAPGVGYMGGMPGSVYMPYAFPIWVETDDPFISGPEIVSPFDCLD